jgi:LmbE family N-acetylglucosaminyl deacetylase
VISAADSHRTWRRLPLGDVNDIIGAGSCLILAPHPDDESLGCGGLIAACAAAGRPPLVTILTDGAGSHPNSRAYPPDRLRALRAQEVRTATGHLGLARDRVAFMDYPDTGAPHHGQDFDAAVATLLALVRSEPACTAILAPWEGDPHCDHQAASLIAAAAANSAAIRHMAYPVWGWTLPAEVSVPGAEASGFRIDTGAFLSAKRAAIRAHQSQYGNLITDDLAGFRLPPNLLSVFDSPFETFIRS